MGRNVARFLARGLALALTTSAAPSFAYRTSEDSAEFQGKGRIAWPGSSMSLVMSEDGLPPGLSKDAVEAALARSLDTWNAPECSALSLGFGGWVQGEPQAMDGKNSIAWVSDWAERNFPADAPGNTNVQYRGSGDDWRIGEADVFLNASGFDWSTDAADGTLVEAVLTHELGHALGLLHPCEPDGQDGAPACDESDATVTETTMYPFYSPEQTSLAADDSAGLCYLYGATDACASCTNQETCVDGECRVACGDTVCEKGQECGFWGCAPAGACLDRSCVDKACEAGVEGACGPLATCTKGRCTKGKTTWGDACTASMNCEKGACLNGICQPDCAEDSECGPLGSCERDADGGASACVESSRYEEGFTCDSGADCGSHICIFMGERAQCTSECKSDKTCLEGWSCRNVEKRDVCVPPDFKPSGGCNVGPASNEPGSLPWLVVALVAATARRRRKTNVSGERQVPCVGRG
jgi:MYXO-CTERM domain-containing protein